MRASQLPSHTGSCITPGHQRALGRPVAALPAARYGEALVTPAHQGKSPRGSCSQPRSSHLHPPPLQLVTPSLLSEPALLIRALPALSPAPQNLQGQEQTCPASARLYALEDVYLPESHPTLGLLPPPPTPWHARGLRMGGLGSGAEWGQQVESAC